ncbi:MAG: hypothetical protein M9963_08215 [Kiritimatiellae bacterium]|nr:hypothetical protein [Kiritimatiellia bacterium]
MRSPTLAAAAVLFVFGLTGIASAQNLELSAQYWEMKPSGSLAIGKDGQPGTSADLGNDLGYKKDKLLGFDAALGDANRLVFSYLDMGLSANHVLTRDLDIDGTRYASGTDVRSTMDIDLMRLAYQMQNGVYGFRGGFLAGVEYIDFKAQARATSAGEAKESYDTILPIVGAKIHLGPPSLRVDISLAGSPWDIEGTRINFIDFEANLKASFKGLFAGIGYRNLSFKAENDSAPLKADVKFRGPQLLAGIMF